MHLGSIVNRPVTSPPSPPLAGEGGQGVRAFALNTHQVLTIVLFIALFTMAVRVPVDTDTWWHLRSGQYIVETRSIPRTDPFSFTRAGAPWIDQSWLAQVLLYGVSRWAGVPGLAILVAGLVVLAFAFVYRQCEGDRFLRAFTLILAATVSSVIWAARPQMLSFVLTAVVGHVLYRYKRSGLTSPPTPPLIGEGRKTPPSLVGKGAGGLGLLWLPPIFLLWVNLHAGYAAGFILVGCTLAGEVANRLLEQRDVPALSWRDIGRLAGVAALSALVIPLNPNGAQMLLYPFKTVNIGVLRDFIQEWASPNFHQLYQQPFIWLLLAVIVTLGLSRRAADITDLLLVGVFAYMGLLAGRNVALFALVAAPVVVRYGDATLRELRRERLARLGILRPRPMPRLAPALKVANWLIVLLIIAAAGAKIWMALQPAVVEQALAATVPLHAAEYLHEQRPAGPMFNSYNWGGFLLWALYPDYRVFVDGRTDLYDDAFLRDYLKVVMARPGWEAVLERYEVNLIVIERDSVLATVLALTPDPSPTLRERGEARIPGSARPEDGGRGGWRLVYSDDLAAVFVREGR